MNVAKKNIDKLLKTIDICIDKGGNGLYYTITSSSHGISFSYTPFSIIKCQIKNGFIKLSKTINTDTVECFEVFGGYIGGIYDLYRLMREYDSKGLLK